MLKQHIDDLQKQLIDEKTNKIIVCSATYSILGLVALVMTLMNIFTHKGVLTWSTGIFTVLCLINLILALYSPKTLQVSIFLFAVEALVLFTYFLISGNPEGFSAIWVCMLPSMGMFFFGRDKGSLLCMIMALILAFLLWTDVGRSFLMYDYTASFKMRFPVLFMAFHLLAFFLESLRMATYREMTRMQVLYKELSAHDPLTGVYNRQGMYSVLNSERAFQRSDNLGVVMLDIDHFKEFNDTYGHDTGDIILKGLAKTVENELKAIVCRWGGEEFVAVYTDNNVTREDVEHLRCTVAATSYLPDIPTVTVSIGVCEDNTVHPKDIDELISRADSLLYKAKNAGRNQIVYS